MSSVQYPERLRVGEDVQEDVTAARGKTAQYMNQSVFSMIAAAGSKTDFHARFEGEGSSDSEEDQESSNHSPTLGQQIADTPLPEYLSKEDGVSMVGSKLVKSQAKSKDRKMLCSLPKLKLKTPEEKNYMAQSILLPPKEVSSSQESPKGITPRDAPVMGKMLEAQAELNPVVSSNIDEVAPEDMTASPSKGSSTSLATRLMEIFAFEGPEEVISGVSEQRLVILDSFTNMYIEYPCWLLQSVLLQGYLYITQKHICFFGYLPKKSVSRNPMCLLQ